MATPERTISYSKLAAALVVRPNAELAKRTVPPEAKREDADEAEPQSGTFLVGDTRKE